ncbi:MAG: hypothetical protein JWO38_3774 [Gemmataceae bacterium]|nr:hypothetical protein [Gemmataceae bacterium]
MIVMNPSVLAAEVPTIDISEARWAAAELATLIQKLGPDSPVGMVLRQARREVTSLAQSASASVVGPFRTAA